jgi:sulfur-oxidizing protein SoxX
MACSRKPARLFAVITIMGAMTLAGAATDGIEKPLAAPGDAARGRALFVARDGGHCVLCHTAPGVDRGGNIGPALHGVGKRLTPAQIRLRIVDITRVNPDAAMPAFHRTEGVRRVPSTYAGRPALDGQQVEDLVAWLATLQ